jgi:hypothetical protein
MAAMALSIGHIEPGIGLRQKGFSVTLAPHLESDGTAREACNRTDSLLLWFAKSHRLIGSRFNTKCTRLTGSACFFRGIPVQGLRAFFCVRTAAAGPQQKFDPGFT